MAVTSLQLTYAEIRATVAQDRGFARDPSNWDANQIADVARWLRSGLRKALHPAALGPGESPHQWSFLRPPLTITTTAPYETGTIAIASGVVTLAGGTFPTSAASSWLVVEGIYHKVSTRDSGSQLTLEDTSVTASAGTEYSLRRYQYTMPADFESLTGNLTFSPGESQYNKPLERLGDEQIRTLHQTSDQNSFGEPKYYAVVPAAPVTTAVQVWYLLLYPTARQIYHLNGRYQVIQSDLDGTNQYPPGGAQFSQLVLEAVLSEAELARHDPGPHTEAFRLELASAVARDRAASAPDTLGCPRVQGEKFTHKPEWMNQNVIYSGTSLSDYT